MSRNQIIIGLLILAAVGVTVFVVTNRKDTALEPEKPGVTDPERKPPTPPPPPPEQRLLTDVPAEPKAFLQWAAETPSGEISSAALEAVGRLSGPWTDEIIAKALAKDEDGEYEDEEVAAAAMLVKAQRGDPGLMPALAALLVQSDENWDADALIARALGLIPGEESLNMLVALVNREDPDEDTCQVAIRSLAAKEGTVARDAIKSLLDYDDENVQAAAAAALLRYDDADAKKLIDAHFVDPDASDWDEDVLAASLGIKGSAQALPYLLRLNANEFWDTRQFAVRALGATRLPEAKKPLLDAMADEDEDVSVTAAAVLLSDFGDETGIDLLLKTIESSNDPELRTLAVRALGDLGRAEHADLFKKQFAAKATKVEHLPGKLWAAYAVLNSTK